MDKCENCNNTTFIFDYKTASIICKNCGTVAQGKSIDYDREWRVFFNEVYETKVRTGAPETLAIHDKGIGTDIKTSVFDNLSSLELERMRNLQKFQKRIRITNSVDRNLYNAFEILEHIASMLNLPKDVKETAALIYRRAIKSNRMKGKSIRGMLAVSIYFSCKISNLPISLDKIMKLLKISKKNVSRCYSIMIETLPKEYLTRIKTPNSLIYIPQLINKLNLGPEVEIFAKNILQEALKNGIIAGKSPRSLAAAAVYVACSLTNNKKTQRQIADVANVTEVTIRNRSKELIRSLNVEINL
jgi:transcription initiation factor TFIIB